MQIEKRLEELAPYLPSGSSRTKSLLKICSYLSKSNDTTRNFFSRSTAMVSRNPRADKKSFKGSKKDMRLKKWWVRTHGRS